MENLYFFVILAFLLEAVMVLGILDSEHNRFHCQNELMQISQSIGEEKAQEINLRAFDWYRTLLLDTQYVENTMRYLSPKDSKGMEGLSDKVFPFLRERAESFFYMVYWLLCRFSYLVSFMFFVVPMFLCSLLTALLERLIKQRTFDFSSPIVNAYASKLSAFFLLMALVILFVPYEIPLILEWVLLVGSFYMLGVSISTMVKRLR